MVTSTCNSSLPPLLWQWDSSLTRSKMTADSLENVTSRSKAGVGEETLNGSSGQSPTVANGVASPEVVEDAIRPLLKQPESSKYPEAKFELEDRYIDEPRSLRVVVIGAGLTGVTAGVLLPAKVPGIKLTIFEKNADVVRDHLPQYIRRTITNDVMIIL